MISEMKKTLNAVCRLCLKQTKDLVHAFEKENDSGVCISEVVLITTGIEIKSTDEISQKICERCRSITKKMHTFRVQATKNDKLLKEKLRLLITKEEREKKTDNRSSNNENPLLPQNNSSSSPCRSLNSCRMSHQSPGKSKPIARLPNCKSAVHKSVLNVLMEYPNLLVPRSCIEKNIQPSVVLDSTAVKNYLKIKENSRLNHSPSKKNSKQSEEYSKISPVRENKICAFKRKSCSVESNVKKQKIQLSKEEIDSKSLILSGNNVLTSKDEEVPLAHKDDPNSNISQDTNNCISSIHTNMNGAVEIYDNVTHKDAAGQNSPTNLNLNEVIALTSDSDDDLTDASDLLESVKESTSVFVCIICNSVWNEWRNLKLHSRAHMTCPFCKQKFKSLENKEIHLQNECKIRSIMQNLPTVSLSKVDEDETMKRKFPNAFKYLQKKGYHGSNLMSDDDECAIIDYEINLKIDTSKGQVEIKRLTHLNNLLLEGIYSDINDVDLLKSLLKKYCKSPLNIPSNKDIQVTNNKDVIVVLRGFTPFLLESGYMIPVDISISSDVEVKYDFESTNLSHKSVNLWNPHKVNQQRLALLNSTPSYTRTNGTSDNQVKTKK